MRPRGRLLKRRCVKPRESSRENKGGKGYAECNNRRPDCLRQLSSASGQNLKTAVVCYCCRLLENVAVVCEVVP